MISVGLGRPFNSRARCFLLDPLAHRMALGQLHTPGVSHMGQQQLGEAAVHASIPVHPVEVQVLPRVAEVKMQVQYIEVMFTCLGGAIEVGFDHSVFQEGGLLLPELGRKKTRVDFLAHRHGRVPHQEARLGQHLPQAPEQVLQVLQVAPPGVRTIPGDVPEAGIHDDQVGGMLTGLQLFQDGLEVVGVHTGEEVKTHQMVVGAELADLTVVTAVVHVAPLASVHQLILFEVQLPLCFELLGSEQAVLLQQKYQVLVYRPMHRVPQDDHELIVEQLPHFGGPQEDHDAQGARPSSFPCTGWVCGWSLK